MSETRRDQAHLRALIALAREAGDMIAVVRMTAALRSAPAALRCYCPDDCSCRRAQWNPYVVAICGCQQHEAQR